MLSAVKRLENKNRSDLFGTSTDGTETRLRSAASAQQMLDQSTKVTNNLGGLLAQMSSQVKQSEETLGVLLTSSEVITETEGEFNSMRGQIHTSNALLSKYARREITDRFLLALALLLYFGTVAYIVRKRLFGV